MSGLSSTTGIVALSAAGAALVALILLLIVWLKLRRLQQAQRVVLGDEQQDVVTHAATLQRRFESLHEYVIEVITKIDGRMDAVEERMDGTVAHHAVVRFDAYNEMSGRQSTSIALLDARRSGVVLSSIHHRDQARIYVKQVREGVGEIALSPEELEAMRAAMAREFQGPPAAPADA